MVRLFSFSYRYNKLPSDACRVIDCRVFTNPHNVGSLRSLDGRSPQVQEHLSRDSRFIVLLNRLLVSNLEELPIYFGCIGGKHRSVAMAEMLGKALVRQDVRVEITHLNLS